MDPALGPNPHPLVLGTIITRSQLALGRVFVDRLRVTNSAPVSVLVVDDRDDPLPEVGDARVLSLADVGVAREDALLLALTRPTEELTKSLRPRLLAFLLDEGAGAAAYLAPSTLVEGRLDGIADLAAGASFVVLPKLLAPLPRDALEPSETEARRGGAVSPALVAVTNSDAGHRFLEWWQPRGEALTEVVDDRVLDFAAVSMPDALVIRDAGWNLSRWLAAPEDLTTGPDGSVLVQGRPLVLLDLDGYVPERPHLLSERDASQPRLLLSEVEPLRTLCEGHRERLVAAGHVEQSALPAPFVHVDGIRVDDRVRRLVREYLLHGGDAADLTSSVASWLSRPFTSEPGFPVVGRLLHDVLADRADLRVAFPELERGQADRFLSWAEDHGEKEEGVSARLVGLVRARLDASSAGGADIRVRPRRSDAVTAVGFFSGDFGIGQAGRMLVAGLESAHVPVETHTYRRTASRLGTPWVDRALPQGARSDVVIMCLNADTLAVFVEEQGDQMLRNRYVIGLWFWELEDLPAAWLSSLDLVDEVWVASDFNRAALAAVTDKPVRVVPLPVHVPERTDVRPEEMGHGSKAFTFGFVFDHLSVFERKNPLGLVQAYTRAFPEPGHARLVIKSINGSKKRAEREALRYSARGRSDILLIERYLSREELDGLMWGLDSYVSLHRSEGFGFGMAEAMGMGKAVIATSYSGNLTFMRQDNSRLVQCRMRRVPPGNEPYPTTARWAQPSVPAAARAMRRLHGDPELVARLGERARETIAANHTPEAAGAFAARRLARIRDGLPN